MNQDDLLKQISENENITTNVLHNLNIYKGSYLLCLNYRLEYKRITPELYNELVEKFNSLPIKKQTKKDEKHSKWNDKEWAKHQFVPNPLITKKEAEEAAKEEKFKLQQKRASQIKEKRGNEPKFKKVMRFIFWPYKKPSSNIFYLLWIAFPIGAFSGKSINDIDIELILSIVAVFLIFRFFAWSFDNDKNIN